MAATAKVKRALLRGIYSDATEDGSDLLTALNAKTKTFRDKTSDSGLVVISTSSSGITTTRSLPSTKDSSTDDWWETYEELIKSYEEAKAYLVAAGDASPTDAEIFTQMMAQLETVSSFVNDFSGVIR